MDGATYPTRWTEQDVAGLSWHDCHVHAIRIRNPEEGFDFDLILDIDYILEWIEAPQGPHGNVNFVVAPALLTFSKVKKLAIDLELEYKEDLEIDRIQRGEVLARADSDSNGHEWIIHFHSQAGRSNQIRFRSGGFILKLTGQPRRIDRQWFEDHDR
ncbi:MAG: hypothetical protein LLG00_09840 [Planctomycetaceae bacterium]|nr:hypothetical protein [Planctomycetaceae bacterium]